MGGQVLTEAVNSYGKERISMKWTYSQNKLSLHCTG
jgi:hypothetical protein